jgi:hypothetical protein
MRKLIAIIIIVSCTGCAGAKGTFTLRAHASHNIYTGNSYADVEVYTNTR